MKLLSLILTALMAINVSSSFTYVGEGYCLDSIGSYYDLIRTNGVASLSVCESLCTSHNTTDLRGINYWVPTRYCFCWYEKGADFPFNGDTSSRLGGTGPIAKVKPNFNENYCYAYEQDTNPNPTIGGDPHIITWKKEHYEYHGQCDLVLMDDSKFDEGQGLDIHIRTKIVRHWSYIKNVSIKIGNDILEIEGSVDANDAEAHYWINFEYQGELETLGGFPVTQKLPSVYKRQFTIDLSSKYPGQNIVVELYKEFIRVNFNGKEEVFGNTVGLMGDYNTGKTLARDGITVINDFTELGDEWQVLPSEPKLFHEISHPQFPELCIKPEDPRGERKRRLAESSISIEQAEKACATLKDPLSIKDCVYDILATQDLDMVGAF